MGSNSPVSSVAVLGFGTMGQSIARLLLRHGVEVSAYDPLVDEASLPESVAAVRLAPTLEECLDGADVVIEAVFEQLDVKLELLERVSNATEAIIASNTSTFMPSLLVDAVRRPERFLIAHFFNPADVVPLVEIVPGPHTDPEAVRTVFDLMVALDRKPVLLERECPGFVANRLQAAMARECIALIEQGIVSPESIDQIVKTALAPRWKAAGPIGVADLAGLDIYLALSAQLFPSLSDTTEPQRTLRELVENGSLGAKSGQGFYSYTPEGLAATRAAIAAEFETPAG